MKKYKTIVIDPPWKYGKWGKASKPNFVGHIPVMKWKTAQIYRSIRIDYIILK